MKNVEFMEALTALTSAVDSLSMVLFKLSCLHSEDLAEKECKKLMDGIKTLYPCSRQEVSEVFKGFTPCVKYGDQELPCSKVEEIKGAMSTGVKDMDLVGMFGESPLTIKAIRDEVEAAEHISDRGLVDEDASDHVCTGEPPELCRDVTEKELKEDLDALAEQDLDNEAAERNEGIGFPGQDRFKDRD